jgi:hypothetical protein
MDSKRRAFIVGMPAIALVGCSSLGTSATTVLTSAACAPAAAVKTGAASLWSIGLGMAEAAANVLLPGSGAVIQEAIAVGGPIFTRLTTGTALATDEAQLTTLAQTLIFHAAPVVSVKPNLPA